MEVDKELANHVARVAFKSASELGDLVPLLKTHCGEEEYEKFSMAIALIAGRIGREILDRIYKDHPDIESDIDDKITKYGRLI